MSWIEKIKLDYIITCGEGSEFRPAWMNAVKTKEYNVTEFTFPEISGTLVKRQRPRGRKYGIEIFFQGEDHLDVSEAFETAADDSRPWVITHPYYNRIVVQPLSLNFDNSKHNVTKISGTVIETITDDNPKTTVDPVDNIVSKHLVLDDTLAAAYENDVIPVIADINQMTKNNNFLFSEGIKIISDNDDFENYFNLFNTANSSILNATAAPLLAIRSLQAVINAPALFQSGMSSRIGLMDVQLETLRVSINAINETSLKSLFENNSAALVSTKCLSLVSNTDYKSRNEVFSFVDDLSVSYNQYLNDLDLLQSDNYNSPESFIPGFDQQRILNDLVNFTISKLFEIAIDARQERILFLENDDNIITLSHRFYGLEVDDSTIDEFIETNDIGLNEYLGLKKGRKIVYFV